MKAARSLFGYEPSAASPVPTGVPPSRFDIVRPRPDVDADGNTASPSGAVGPDIHWAVVSDHFGASPALPHRISVRLSPARARLSSRCSSPFNKARARSSACHQHSRAAASPLREAPILVAAPISPAKRIKRSPTRARALSRYALASPACPTAGAHERSVSADLPLPQAVHVPAPESAPDAAGCCSRGQPASAEEKNRRSESVVSPDRSRSPPAIAAPAPHIRSAPAEPVAYIGSPVRSPTAPLPSGAGAIANRVPHDALRPMPRSPLMLSPAHVRNRKRKAGNSQDMKESADVALASRITRQTQPLQAAARLGKRLRTNMFKQEAVDSAADEVLRALPRRCILDMMQEDNVTYENLNPDQVFAWFRHRVKSQRHAVSAAALRGFLAAYRAVLQWCEDNEVAVIDHVVPSWRISEFLAAFRAQKIARISAQNEDYQAAHPEAPPAGSSKSRRQTGYTAGSYYLRYLQEVGPIVHLPWRMAEVDLAQNLINGRRPAQTPATPVTIRMLVALELFLAKSDNPVHKHLAAAYLFCAYGSLRCAQAQECWVDSILDDQSGQIGNTFIKGFVMVDKNPKKKNRYSRPFWLPLFGVLGSRLWFDELMSSLSDVADDCYIFRGFDSPDGSVARATSLLPGPLLTSSSKRGESLVLAMQELLQLACGLSHEESKRFTLHSPRHFLPECAKGRSEPPPCANELGRWSSSVAQMPSLRPEAHWIRAHRARVSILPDLYAPESSEARPLTIIRRQMSALQEFVSSFDLGNGIPANFPAEHAWNLLRPFSPSGGPFEI